MTLIMDGVSKYAIPVIFLLILSMGLGKEVKVYDAFLEGAKEGFTTVIRIIPALIGLMVAIGVFRASGALDTLVFILKPIGQLIGLPKEAIPLAVLRPISGSASLALVSDILNKNGPDSFVGRLVSVMMGSTETIIYTMTVYFGAVGISKTRHTLPAALLAELCSIISAVFVCSLFFGR